MLARPPRRRGAGAGPGRCAEARPETHSVGLLPAAARHRCFRALGRRPCRSGDEGAVLSRRGKAHAVFGRLYRQVLGHSTGTTVDLGLANADESVLDFGSPFDLFDPKSATA